LGIPTGENGEYDIKANSVQLNLELGLSLAKTLNHSLPPIL
jgi:hypothetical protein